MGRSRGVFRQPHGVVGSQIAEEPLGHDEHALKATSDAGEELPSLVGDRQILRDVLE